MFKRIFHTVIIVLFFFIFCKYILNDFLHACSIKSFDIYGSVNIDKDYLHFMYQKLSYYILISSNVLFLNSVILREFSGLTSSVFIDSAYHAHIFLDVKAPLCVLNNQYAITDNNLLSDFTMYECKSNHALPMLMCANDSFCIIENRKLIVSFVDSIKNIDHSNYIILWNDENNIDLQMKSDPWFHIITSLDSCKNKHLFDYCTLIKNKYLNNDYKKSCHKKMICFADIRFNHQIIVSWKKEGMV